MPAGDGRPSVALLTLGCKVNQYDSEALAEALRRAGWTVKLDLAADDADPDVVIINSCAVTSRAEAKSRQAARKAAKEHPGSRIVLAGCYPQVAPDSAGGVKGLAGLAGTAREDTVRMVQGLLAGSPKAGAPVRSVPESFETLPVAARPERVRAYLKVQEGCSNDCAYCIIPVARGRDERSRPLAGALEQARALLAGGARELVLTGIRLGAYGGGGRALVELVEACLELPGLARLRLSSIEPTDIPPDLLKVIAADARACQHLHVPLQSGSDGVLQRMGRRYDTAWYRGLIEDARRAIPGLAVTTDVLVGFPGETEDEFSETIAYVREMRFTRLHVFPYSRRAGTPAAGLPGQVPARVRAERARVLGDVGRELSLEFHQGLVGRDAEVLVEREPEKDRASDLGAAMGRGGARYVTEGLTGQYVRVEIESPQPLALGSLPMVRLTGASAGGMRGRVSGVENPGKVDHGPPHA